MAHSTKLPIEIEQSFFYKAPIPLLIGNLPFGDDFKEKRDEYEYLDYYIVPKQGSDLYGILYYNKFFKNFTMICKDAYNNGPLNWSKLYPNFYINGATYSLNPFVNDVNGACAWIKEQSYYDPFTTSTYTSEYDEQTSSAAKVYYNFSRNQYEFGLGEDVFQYNGVTYQVNNANKCNAFSYNNEMEKISEVNNYFTIRNITEAKNYDPRFSSLNVGFTKKLKASDEIEDLDFNFEDLTDEKNFDRTFSCVPVNNDSLILSYGHYETKNCVIRRSENFDTQRLFYDRLDFLKDLDHEDEPEKYEKMCGVYEDMNGNDSTIIGSVVIGNEQHREDFGWFIGTNLLTHDYKYAFGENTSTWTSQRKIQATNVIPIPINREVNVGETYNTTYYEHKMTDNNYDFIIVLGYAWKFKQKRFLVYFYSRKGKFIGNKWFRTGLYIVDDSPHNLFKYDKIWFSYVSGLESNPKYPPKLFRHPFKYYSFPGYIDLNEITFEYRSLDDEYSNGEKNEITLKILGTCRENAYEKITQLPISKESLENMFTNEQTTYTNWNVYIGYWDTPIINFKETSNE